MFIHPQNAGMRLRSSVMLLLVVGNLLFSTVFVCSTGVHVVKAGKQNEALLKVEKEPVKEQKLLTLAQIQ